jgi:two-component system, NarL family, response regulator DegU
MVKTRLLLVDDHTMFRDGLRTILEREDDMAVVGEAADVATAVRLSDELRPDVVLMDVHLGLENGVDATREIMIRRPESRVIALTMTDNEQLAMEMIQAGAQGYVLKDEPAVDLVRAVREVVAGGTVIEPRVASGVLTRYRQIAAGERGEPNRHQLTDRMLELLSFLVQGESNYQISKRLHLSEQTVKNYLSKIYQRLGVCNRTEAVIVALREGLVDRGQADF